MSKGIRKIIGTAAPLVGLIPGIGLPAAIALGAGGGLLSGGGLRGALAGGLGAATLGGGGQLLGGALGASGATANALGSGLLGAGAGAASGGLKGALLGGAAGGLGGYASGGGFDGLGNSLGLTGEGSILGTSPGTPLSGGAAGPTQGSGILGGVGRATSELGSALGVGSGGSSTYGGSNGGSSYSNIAALLGGVNSLNANDKAQKDLIAAENASIGQLQPYLASGQAANSRLSDLLGTSSNSSASGYGSLNTPYTPEDLQNDPGYQFQLQQGNQALDRQQAAKGNYFSGSALKAAQDYGTGLADQTYKDAFARDQSTKAQQYGMYSGQAGSGQQAAGSAANAYENIGGAKAASGIAGSNILNQTLSGLLSGSGAKRLVGYGTNGQPIYA